MILGKAGKDMMVDRLVQQYAIRKESEKQAKDSMRLTAISPYNFGWG